MTNDKNIDRPIYSISSAARLLDISVHTIRMYEREGLIIPSKEENKNRLYSERDIERLRCLRNGIREKKYSISSVKAMLSLLPCWAVMNCQMEEREVCPAYLKAEKPCWTYEHKGNVCEKQDCRKCEVYMNLKCDDIKNTIRKYSTLEDNVNL